MKKTLSEVLRWTGIIPAAIIVPALASMVLIIMMLIGDLFSGELWLYLKHPEIFSLDHFFVSFVVSALCGSLTVYVGAEVAPRYKKAVAFALFGIVSVALGSVSIILLLSNGFSETWRVIVNSIIWIIAGGITAYNYKPD